MAKRVFTVAAGVALLALGGFVLFGRGATTGGYSEAIPIQEVAPQPEAAQPETQGRDCPARDGGSARGGYGDASGEGQYVSYRYGRGNW